MSACSSSGATATGVAVTDGRLPCNVEEVLEDRCLRCHSNPPVMNAPFPLETYADTQTAYPGTNRPVWTVMEDVLTPTDVMPPNAPFLTDAGLHTLLDWIDAGAPPAAGDGGCE